MPAVAAIAAVAASEVTAAMVFAAVAQVGIGLTVVGAVTGNQGLMKIGSVMGLAGGIGGLATGAANAAGSAIGSEVSGLTPAEVAAQEASSSGALGAEVGATNPTTAGLDQFVSPTESGIQGSVSQAGQAQMTGASQMTSPAGAELVTPKPASGLVDATTTSPATGSSFVDQANNLATSAPGDLAKTAAADPMAVFKGGAESAGAVGGELSNGIQSSKNFWSGFTDLLKTKEGANGAMQLAGGALQGMGSMYNADRNYDINKQFLDLKKEQYANEVANANAIPNINIGLNPNPKVYGTTKRPVYQGIGLIGATR